MKNLYYAIWFALYFLLNGAVPLIAQPVQPEQYVGFKPGTDRKLFTYEQLIGYLSTLDEQSPNLEMREIGLSPMGRKMYIAFISAPENLQRLDRLQEINRRLALDPEMEEADRSQLITEGRVFFLATLSMHESNIFSSDLERNTSRTH